MLSNVHLKASWGSRWGWLKNIPSFITCSMGTCHILLIQRKNTSLYSCISWISALSKYHLYRWLYWGNTEKIDVFSITMNLQNLWEIYFSLTQNYIRIRDTTQDVALLRRLGIPENLFDNWNLLPVNLRFPYVYAIVGIKEMLSAQHELQCEGAGGSATWTRVASCHDFRYINAEICSGSKNSL